MCCAGVGANDSVICNVLKEFELKGHDINDLKKRAESFIGLVEKQLPKLETISDQLYLEDLQGALAAILAGQDVFIAWSPMADPDMEGVIYTVKRANGTCSYFIYLNQNITKLLGDDIDIKAIRSAKPNDPLRAKAYWRALKSVYLHEISHLLLSHGNEGLVVSPFGDGGEGALPIVVEMCCAVNRLYAKVQIGQDFDCDLFSLVLAFWPSKKFKQLVMSVLANWEKGGDIRAGIANLYHMPLNATLQWMTIQFCDKLGMHYIRREESSKKWLDYLDYYANLDCYLDEGHLNHLFTSKDTAAAKAEQKKADQKTIPTESCPFICAAFYEEQQYFYNRKSDEILVIGFNWQRVREARELMQFGLALHAEDQAQRAN